MGDIAFGKDFNMINSGKSHFALDLLIEGMRPLGLLGGVPWFFVILSSTPGVANDFKRFISWCGEQIALRKKMELEVPDVMSWLIAATEEKVKSLRSVRERSEEEKMLESDSRLIIVAGSDTTASTMTHIIYHLCESPGQVEKLRAELKAFEYGQEGFSFKDLQSANHLNGIINEVLRLHPAVPSGVLRKTPVEGIEINGTFIPGETTVCCPPWTIGRRMWFYPSAIITLLRSLTFVLS